jgi:hypothetical protein
MEKVYIALLLIPLLLASLFIFWSVSRVTSFELEGYEKVLGVEVRMGPRESLLIFQTQISNLTMIIGNDQALSIDWGIRGIKPSRPNTHDLLVRMLSKVGAKVIAASVDSLEEANGGQVYKATLYLDFYGRIIRVDSRPSDATAITLRTGSPIYIDESLLGKEIEIEEGVFEV